MRVLIFFVLTALSITASAHTTSKIKSILLVEDSNLIYIYPESGVTNPPACHGSNGDYISYKMSRPMADKYYSLLMMAFASQKTVYLYTKGTCTDQPFSETLSYIKVND